MIDIDLVNRIHGLIDCLSVSWFEFNNNEYDNIKKEYYDLTLDDVDKEDPPIHIYYFCLSHIKKPSHDQIEDVIKNKNILCLPDYMGGSDYSGSTVEKSNYQVFLERHENKKGVYDLSGSHGTYAIGIRPLYITQEILEDLNSLEQYPVLDDDHHIQLEMDLIDEAWIDGGYREINIELDDNNYDAEGLTNDQWSELVREYEETKNDYPFIGVGCLVYLPTNKIAEWITSSPEILKEYNIKRIDIEDYKTDELIELIDHVRINRVSRAYSDFNLFIDDVIGYLLDNTDIDNMDEIDLIDYAADHISLVYDAILSSSHLLPSRQLSFDNRCLIEVINKKNIISCGVCGKLLSKNPTISMANTRRVIFNKQWIYSDNKYKCFECQLAEKG